MMRGPSWLSWLPRAASFSDSMSATTVATVHSWKRLGATTAALTRLTLGKPLSKLSAANRYLATMCWSPGECPVMPRSGRSASRVTPPRVFRRICLETVQVSAYVRRWKATLPVGRVVIS